MNWLRRNSIACCCLILGLGASSHCLDAQIAPESGVATQALDESTWRLVSEIFNTVETHHIDAPTKQQFMLMTARTLFRLAGKPVPPHLSQQASRMTSDDDFQVWLDEKLVASGLSQSEELEHFHDILANTLVMQLPPTQSSFTTASANRIDKQLQENQYVGIGIQIRSRENSDYQIIAHPFPGGPARMAGARAGDQIMEIDGQSAKGESLASVVERLRGEKGTRVSVVVSQPGQDEQRHLEMIRNVVPIASVKGRRQKDDGTWVFADLNDRGLAYIRIDEIVGSTAAELQQVSRELKAGTSEGGGVRALILDLRHAVFADVHYATMVADELLPETKLGVLQSKDGTRRTVTTRPENSFEGIPIAVLAPTNVSGPMFALLKGLKQREDTRIVSALKSITSNSYCYDSFELANGLGAIRRLPFARFEFAPAAPESAFEERSHRGAVLTPTQLNLMARLEADIVETQPDQQTATASRWLSDWIR